MNAPLVRLATRIRDELEELEVVLKRVEDGWGKYTRSTDDHYLDGVALNLHGFYNGLERVFELIATIIDGTKPDGEYWHQALLQQMSEEKPSIRPAVLSDLSYQKLDEYRGFRHVVRNVYTYKFDPTKVKKLVDEAPGLYRRVHAELRAFADFLEQQIDE
ncbi:MAG: hypothetical protein H8D34_02345 [Chloroflexi bacterium]|nr:hypothetical protein [Chloroflexota bacterium]MBL7164790.1 hypothetical protein [Anaerolineales bacterium]